MSASLERREMRKLVIGILSAARDRWPWLSTRDRVAIVKHIRAIADHLETCIHRRTAL